MDGSDLLTTKEVAERLRVSLGTVQHWVRSGELEALRPGVRSIRVPSEALAAFVARRSVEFEQVRGG